MGRHEEPANGLAPGDTVEVRYQSYPTGELWSKARVMSVAYDQIVVLEGSQLHALPRRQGRYRFDAEKDRRVSDDRECPRCKSTKLEVNPYKRPTLGGYERQARCQNCHLGFALFTSLYRPDPTPGETS